MLNIRRILLPVDIPIASLSVIHQAATLARHFSSELVMLHVITARDHAVGVPERIREMADKRLMSTLISAAEKRHDQSLGPELDSLAIRGTLVEGDPALTIVQTAEEEKADLVMMPSHGFTFDQFLLGSVAGKVLHRTDCPAWTGAHAPESPSQTFAIRNVMCGVDFGPRCLETVAWAARMAAEFGAGLALANVTASVEFWSPGGIYVNQEWKEALVAGASEQMASLQHDAGIKADIFIGSGDVPKVLSEAAKQTKADLLVTGCYPYGGHLRSHCYGIICSVPTPVLSL